MTTEPTVSFKTDVSEVASAPQTLRELVERLSDMVAGGKMRATGRTMLKMDEVMGLIEDVKRELPKITSVADQIVMKREELLSEAETYMDSTRQLAQKEVEEMRSKAREEREAIIAQAKKKSQEIVEQSSVIKASKVEAERIIEDANEEKEKILVRSKREANTIVNQADERARRQTMETDEYSKRMLMKLEERLSYTLQQIRQGIDSINESLEEREKMQVRANMMRGSMDGAGAGAGARDTVGVR